MYGKSVTKHLRRRVRRHSVGSTAGTSRRHPRHSTSREKGHQPTPVVDRAQPAPQLRRTRAPIAQDDRRSKTSLESEAAHPDASVVCFHWVWCFRRRLLDVSPPWTLRDGPPCATNAFFVHFEDTPARGTLQPWRPCSITSRRSRRCVSTSSAPSRPPPTAPGASFPAGATHGDGGKTKSTVSGGVVGPPM